MSNPPQNTTFLNIPPFRIQFNRIDFYPAHALGRLDIILNLKNVTITINWYEYFFSFKAFHTTFCLEVKIPKQYIFPLKLDIFHPSK